MNTFSQFLTVRVVAAWCDMLFQCCGAELPTGFDACHNYALYEGRHKSCVWASCAYGNMDNEVLRLVAQAKIPFTLKRVTLELIWKWRKQKMWLKKSCFARTAFQICTLYLAGETRLQPVCSRWLKLCWFTLLVLVIFGYDISLCICGRPVSVAVVSC